VLPDEEKERVGATEEFIFFKKASFVLLVSQG
jgi:hypothetical protein